MKSAAAILALCLLCSVQATTYTLYLGSGPETQVTGPELYYGGNSVVVANQAVNKWVTSQYPGGVWIWDSTYPTNDKVPQECFFSRIFEVQGTVTAASLWFSADDNAQISINGQLVTQTTGGNYWSVHKLDVHSFINSGINILNISVINSSLGPAGLIYYLTVSYSF